MTPRPDLPPLPPGWEAWEAGVSTPENPLWCAEDNGTIVHVSGGGFVYCYTKGVVAYDEFMAVLAHLRALSTRDATTGEG